MPLNADHPVGTKSHDPASPLWDRRAAVLKAAVGLVASCDLVLGGFCRVFHRPSTTDVTGFGSGTWGYRRRPSGPGIRLGHGISIALLHRPSTNRAPCSYCAYELTTPTRQHSHIPNPPCVVVRCHKHRHIPFRCHQRLTSAGLPTPDPASRRLASTSAERRLTTTMTGAPSLRRRLVSTSTT